MTLRAHFSIVGQSVAVTMVRHGETANMVLRLLPAPNWEPVIPGAETSPTTVLASADSEPLMRALAYLEHVAQETP